ncbi:MAG: penicillin-binding protein 2 [Gammaproteobacteria bacterium]|nr:penicillin-binding protein 2 [Gammaproteobacteria bacterium]
MIKINHNNKNIYNIRLFLIVGIIIAIAFCLVARLSYLFLVQKNFLEKQGAARTLRTNTIPAYRGIIFDRMGEPLAVSTAVETIWANPRIILHEDNYKKYSYSQLNQVLNLPKDYFYNKLQENKTKEFVYIKRHIAPDIAELATKLDLPGIYSKREFRRYYPNGEVTSQLLGITSIDEQGQEGVEFLFDKKLRGTSGKTSVLQDRLGRTIKTVKQISVAKPGENITLSIDLRLQYLTYTALAKTIAEHNAEAGIAIIVDIKSGEILALANQPSFNPNGRGDVNYKEVRNRAVTDLFEPGSILKPISMAAVLNTNRISEDLVVDTDPGWYKIDNKVVRDIRNFGPLSLSGILKKSSNIGVAKLTLQFEPENLINLLYKFGFTSPTAVNLPGEAAGWINQIKPGQHHKLATLSFGYGISATPMQLMQAYTVFANDGKMIPLSFLKNNHNGLNNQNNFNEQVISKAVANKILKMLNDVVQPDGTGRLAAIPNYELAGKSGTTRRVTDGGYDENRHNSMFIGMAPYPNPKLAMLIFVIDPKNNEYYGGAVAGPVFSKVMASALKLYGIPPNNYKSDVANVAGDV